MSLQKCLAVLSLFFVALLPVAAIAQQPAAAPAATGATVHGTVVDPDDALIPGTTVTLNSAGGKTQSTTAKSDGTYSFRGVAPGALYHHGECAWVRSVFQRPGYRGCGCECGCGREDDAAGPRRRR
jgi:hypothetical protein